MATSALAGAVKANTNATAANRINNFRITLSSKKKFRLKNTILNTYKNFLCSPPFSAGLLKKKMTLRCHLSPHTRNVKGF
jgi:hypothetical protein